MTNDEKWAFIKREIDEIQAIDEELSKIMRFLNLQPDSALFNPAYKLLDIAIKSMDMLLDDSDCDWVTWFVCENNFGKSELEAGEVGNMIKVKTIGDLRKVVDG